MLEKMVKELADSVKKSVQAAIEVFAGGLEPRLKAIEGEREAFQAALKSLDDSIEHKLKRALQSLPAPKDGEDGKDVDIADVKLLVDAAVTAAVAEIPAPKDGVDGCSADPEEIKAMVAEAVSAIPPAKDGESVSVDQVKEMLEGIVKEAVAGIELPKPENGRDAAELDIMPLIDEAKSYPRGVYATHRGGLWKSHSTTHGMKGWECIVDGIFKTVVNRIDDRNFCFIVERASGSISKLPFEVESTRYKKIYVEGREYNKGDFVTWAGSLWHCNEKTVEKPGEGSEAWTLAVKKGRDHNPKVKV